MNFNGIYEFHRLLRKTHPLNLELSIFAHVLLFLLFKLKYSVSIHINIDQLALHLEYLFIHSLQSLNYLKRKT